MIISIAAVIAFLLLSAFFSGSETALTGASQAFMLDQEKNEHNPKAKTINRLFKHRDKLIITTLLGSNLFNTMATSLATSVLISLFGSEGVAYATVIMTVLILIYTDMLPKSYSVKHANAVALVVAPMVNFWVAVFSPLTYVLQKIVNLTFRLFKLQSSGENSEDAAISEIRGAIDMYKGEEIKEESEMLKSILDLDDVEVYERYEPSPQPVCAQHRHAGKKNGRQSQKIRRSRVFRFIRTNRKTSSASSESNIC